jgi:hypothetical protein
MASLYHRRWTIEETFDEFKTHLADRKVISRSKRPELVKQEFYALHLTHAAIRKLMTEAADHTQQSAVDLSFIHGGVRVLQRRMPSVGAIPPPKHRESWLDSVLSEIASHRAVASRGKRNIRKVKKRTSNYGARKKGYPINQPCDPTSRILIN